MIRETKTAVPIVLLVLANALPARAEGGVHTQSAMMCGKEFDRDDSGSCFVGKFQKEPVPNVDVAIKLDSGDSYTVNCPSLPAVNNIPLCTLKKSFACGRINNKLFVFPGRFEKGVWNTAGEGASLACASDEYDSNHYPHKNKEENGAVGKCFAWFGYDPAKSRIKFETCLRMARADYCGLGDSYTTQSVVIEACKLGEACGTLPESCFEATWSKSGYVCASHARAPYIKGTISARIEAIKSNPTAFGYTKETLAQKLRALTSCRDDFSTTVPQFCRSDKTDGLLLSRSRIYDANGSSTSCQGEYKP